MHLHKISTTETENLVFALLDNDFDSRQLLSKKEHSMIPCCHSENPKQNASEIKIF